MNYGDLRGPLDFIISQQKEINRHLKCIQCDGIPVADSDDPNESGIECTVAGEGIDVPAGLKSVAIVKTNGTGTITVYLSNGTYDLTLQGEGISDDASAGSTLPTYAILSEDGGTWKWHGIGCIDSEIDLAESLPPVLCGNEVSFDEGGQAFPQIRNIIIGSGIGTVNFDFNAFNIPDKFIVEFDGVEVINTGYRGAAAQQSALTAELASRSLPSETIVGLGLGSTSFEKTTNTQVLTVKVYAPLESTVWNYTVQCL